MILNRQRSVRVAQRPLELFLRRIRKVLGIGNAGLTICFVTDAEIARMNETFRKKRGPTDVLSFPFRARGWRSRKQAQLPPAKAVGPSRSKPGDGSRIRGSEYLGDVAISPETARRRARSHGAEYLGDIAISPRTARRNAKRFERNLSTELQILMLHGVLHLLGHDHERDRGQMNRLERRLQQRLGLT